MKIHHYDYEKYDFRGELENLFEVRHLESIHEKYNFAELFNMKNNSDTLLHDRFYDSIRSGNEFIKKYDRFINEVIPTIIQEDFIYQKMPTLRIHFVGNWATPEFHVDTQEGYYHPAGEMNFILPLTTCYDTNSVWIESEPNKKDYKPIEVKYGELFQFSGGTLHHGNKVNKTNISRVSFDFRILPKSKYNEKYAKKSATTGKSFTVGSYYKERNNNEY